MPHLYPTSSGQFPAPASFRVHLASRGFLLAFLLLAAPAFALYTPITLFPHDPAPGDEFGRYCAFNETGDELAIGAIWDDDTASSTGSVYIYKRVGGAWIQTAKVHADDPREYDLFGRVTALQGNTLVVGCYRNNEKGLDGGAFYVFERVGSAWIQRQKVVASDGLNFEAFSQSLALDGDTIVSGSYSSEYGPASGSVYVYRKIGPTWTETQKIIPPDGGPSDYFGQLVAIEGNILAVGSFLHDANGQPNSGALYIYERPNSTSPFTLHTKLVPADSQPGDLLGIWVSISGTTIIAGAVGVDENGEDAGAVYVFDRIAGTWTQTAKLLAPDGAPFDELGFSVWIRGDWLVATALGAYTGEEQSGAAYVFRRFGGQWIFLHRLVPPVPQPFSKFGWSCNIHQGRVAIGSIHDSRNGKWAGAVYLYELPTIISTGWQFYD